MHDNVRGEARASGGRQARRADDRQRLLGGPGVPHVMTRARVIAGVDHVRVGDAGDGVGMGPVSVPMPMAMAMAMAEHAAPSLDRSPAQVEKAAPLTRH